jgi:histidinol phosphatase-like enzyme
MLLSVTSLVANIEYRYSYLPKKIYENQVFPVTVLAIGIGDKSRDLYFKFDRDSDNQPIFDEPLIVQNNQDCFYTFYFKNNNQEEFKLPLLFVKSKDADVILDEHFIPVSKLKKQKDFAGVIAADIKVETHQASTFDETQNLITVSLEAYEANLENIKLKTYTEQGIENLKRKNSKVEGEYYVVVPSNMSDLNFTYFNTIKEQFVPISIPIKVVETKLTTQLEPNPKNDSFEEIKKITIISFIAFFALMFLWKRDFLYLIVIALLVIVLIGFYAPRKKICINQGAKVRILPTQNSRVSFILEQRMDKVSKLAIRGRYIKIEYNKDRVGWIDEKDTCKD